MQIFDIPINEYQRETTQQGPASFPLAVYHSVISQNVLGFTPWHWHEELQFCYVFRGAIHFHVNQRQFLVQEGNGIFINSGALHAAKAEDLPDSAYLCLDVGLPLLRGFPGSAFEEHYLLPYLNDPMLDAVLLEETVPWQQAVLTDIAAVGVLYEEKAFGYELEIAATLYTLWLHLIQNISSLAQGTSRGRSQTNSTVQKILRYIEKHYRESITIAQIAKDVSSSPSECCRTFKRITGETIFAHLTDYRLDQSALLLMHTALSVSQIAYEVGFGSTSYYIKIFKTRFSITPLQYRRRTACL